MAASAAAQRWRPGRCRCRSAGMGSSPLQASVRSQLLAGSRPVSTAAGRQLQPGDELDDHFTGLAGNGLMMVAGFGSLLSEHSARTTFPDLRNFRPGVLHGYRRVFAHTADIFFVRGIARPGTREIASLSCEPWPAADASGAASEQQAQQAQQVRQQLVVSLFEVPFTPASVAAFIAREHEFRFLAVQPYELVSGQPTPQLAVLCAANSDAHYRATRCPPDEWARRWGVHGVERVWRDDVLPCRVYLRHCVLAAQGFCDEAYASFLDATWLADRKTTVRQWLQQHPEIMQEEPPLELVDRYSG